MKKIYTSMLCILSYLMSIGQVTITDLDLAIGDTVTIEKDTTTIININIANTSGAGQIWDFSNLVSHETDRTLLQNTNVGVANSNFPDADILIYNNRDSSYLYLDKTSSHLKVIGSVEFGNGDTIVNNYIIPFIHFPSSLGTSNNEVNPLFTSSSILGLDPDGILGPHPYVDSFRVRIEQIITLEVDGEGILKLPNGDFNAIRQLTTPINKIYTEMYTNGNWSFISTLVSTTLGQDSLTNDTANTTVRYWSDDPNSNFFMVNYELDSTRTMNSEDIEWVDLAPYNTSIASKSELISNVYPNPAKDKIILSLKEFDYNSSYEILSITGKIISTGTLSSKQNVIDISSLKEGVYFLNLKSKNMSEAIRLVKN